MKTRLETQIEKMQTELNTYVAFSVKMQEKFLKDLNAHIIPLLTKYKTGVVNPCENTFVDKSVIGPEQLYFRVYLNVDVTKLTDLQIKNLKTKLKEKQVPVQWIGQKIELVYS